jgi:hypothetical protein
MKKYTFSKIKKKIIWQIGQTLIKKPSNSSDQVSDLFVWRSSSSWKTYFELINIPLLFDSNSISRHATIVFFRSNGEEFLRESLFFEKDKRQRVSIENLLLKIKKNEDIGNFGTFSIFHTSTPDIAIELNSFLSECGYVSYQYKKSPLTSYVHGNYEAIACGRKGFKMLGGSSFLKRKFNLQYMFNSFSTYDIALVNISNKDKKVDFIILGQNGCILIKTSVRIHSKGCHLFELDAKINNFEGCRLVISSRLIMARPVIFKMEGENMDVFHG